MPESGGTMYIQHKPEDEMRQAERLFPSMLAVIVGLAAAAPAAAQATQGDWSRILRDRTCTPEIACPPRAGMVWDSTNTGPRYPEVLKQVGIGGEVVVSFTVNADGAVDTNSVSVVRTSSQAFTGMAIQAVRRWRFRADSGQRLPASVSAQVQLIFSHEGSCGDATSQQRMGWAAWNQLVTRTCVRSIPRDQVRPHS